MDTAKAEVTSYVNEQVRKAAHRNLLGNSFWKNPSEIVNQRGYRRWTPEAKPETGADADTCYGFNGGYTIDRWYLWHDGNGASLTINDGYIAVSVGSYGTFNQCLPKGVLDPTETYTLVVKHKGEDSPRIYNSSHYFEDDYDYVTILAGSGEVEYAALYEGEYTEETLPEYQPKGYGAELAECQRYLIAIDSGITIGYGAASSGSYAYMTVDLPVSFHEYTNTKPTITGSLEIRGEGKTSAVENGSIWNVCGSKAIVECMVPSWFTAHKFYVLRSTSKILISKEL